LKIAELQKIVEESKKTKEIYDKLLIRVKDLKERKVALLKSTQDNIATNTYALQGSRIGEYLKGHIGGSQNLLQNVKGDLQLLDYMLNQNSFY